MSVSCGAWFKIARHCYQLCFNLKLSSLAQCSCSLNSFSIYPIGLTQSYFRSKISNLKKYLDTMLLIDSSDIARLVCVASVQFFIKTLFLLLCHSTLVCVTSNCKFIPFLKNKMFQIQQSLLFAYRKSNYVAHMADFSKNLDLHFLVKPIRLTPTTWIMVELGSGWHGTVAAFTLLTQQPGFLVFPSRD